MPDDRSPQDALRRLAQAGASGELICASEGAEVHVFFQRGRVAWSIESGRPFAFTRRLFELTGLDRESFQEIVDECRRKKLPLGETLIRWNVASLEQVRDALQRQIVDALSSLLAKPQAKTLFLERPEQYAEYDASLTFSLEEVLGEAQRELFAPEAAASTHAVANERSHADLARRAQERVPGALWSVVLEDGRPVARAPGDVSSARAVHALTERTIDRGADLVAVRTGLGTVVGARLRARERSLWCGLDVDVTVGAAISKLAALLYLEDQTPGPEERRGGASQNASREAGEPAAAIERGGRGDADAAALELMEKDRDIAAVVLLDAEGEATYWALRPTADRREAIDTCARLQGLLTEVEKLGAFGAKQELGPMQKTLVLGEGDAWYFGAEIVGRPGHTAWLLLPRSSSLGLGWAYIGTLARRLAETGEAA